MSEYEMVFMISELANRIWLLLQVWMSIAVGYMALAHLYGHNLGLIKVITLSLIFFLSTSAVFSTALISMEAIEGYHMQLLQLSKTDTLTAGTLALLDARADSIGTKMLIPVCAIFTFLCAFIYMPYTHFSTHDIKS